MPVPKFADLSKASQDLFKDDFGAGNVKVTLKSRASNGVNLKVEGSKTTDTNAVTAELESKFTNASGVTVKETWNTKNNVTTEVSVKDKGLVGSNLSVAATFSPTVGFQTFKVKTDYGTDKFGTDSVFDGKSLTTAGVFQFKHLLVGASTVIDIAKSSLRDYTVGAGYSSGDIVVATSLRNGSDVEGSIYHTPRPDIKAGVSCTFVRGTGETGFDVVGAYAYDRDTTLKAKINSKLALNLAYKQALRPGITLTLSAQIDAARLNSDNHKLGLALCLEN